MTTKLTLTIEKAIIEQAKSYAKNRGKSLSEIITQEHIHTQLLPKLSKLVGVVDLPEDFDENMELRSALEKKHL